MDNRAEEYRRLARECLRLVQTVRRDDSGRLLIEMARVWIRLATEHETPFDPPTADSSRPVVRQQQQQPQLKKTGITGQPIVFCSATDSILEHRRKVVG